MAINPLQLHELEEAEQVSEGFKVTDLASATWVMRKLAAIEAKKREIKAVADAERERIQAWEEAETRKLDGDFERLAWFLEQYHREQMALDPKAPKTIKTPYGRMKIRAGQPKWNYDDEKLLAWMKEHGYAGFIRTKEEPMKAELKKSLQVAGEVAVTEDGELVLGITIEEQPDKFSVEVSE